MPDDKLAAIEAAIERHIEVDAPIVRHIDWGQVVANGGPPCFHVDEDGEFCLRAERWPGHDDPEHPYVSIRQLLTPILATLRALRADARRLDRLETLMREQRWIPRYSPCSVLPQGEYRFQAMPDGDPHDTLREAIDAMEGKDA